ncbi:hypothetical protein HBB16_17610 [Pseudonocardia sp. MCCB 268]|nr:hypothetical protein [Pseudonocardia cytotoxica]
MINRSGEKILPGELEDLLGASDAVAEVAVVGLPDPLLGERVAAAVGAQVRRLDTSPLLRLLGGNVPDYAIPGPSSRSTNCRATRPGRWTGQAPPSCSRHRADLSTT